MRIPNDFRLVLCVVFQGTDLQGCCLLHSMIYRGGDDSDGDDRPT